MKQSKGITTTTTEEQQRRLFRQHCLRFVLLCVSGVFCWVPLRGVGVHKFGLDDLAGRTGKEYDRRLDLVVNTHLL